MKTLVAAFVTALLVFTLATAWLEVVQPRLDALAGASVTKATESVAKSTSARSKRRPSVDEDESDTVDEVPVSRSDNRRSSSGSQKADATQQEFVKLREEMERLKKHDLKLAAREEMLRLAYDDIRAEITALNDSRRRMSNDVAMTSRRAPEKAVGRMNYESSPSEVLQQPIANAKSRQPGNHQTSELATIIQNLANDGSISIAASLLSGLREREAAKVLTTISNRDPRLAIQLSSQLQAAKDPPVKR